MKESIKRYAKIGFSHHCFFPCRDNPVYHLETLPRVVNRKDIEVTDLTIPYGKKFREAAADFVRKSGKIIVYNGYLMPTSKIPLGTLSFTERQQIVLLAKDQVDAAYACGARYFMQSVGADPGPGNRRKAFEGLGEYIFEVSSYITGKGGNMPFLIELMDREICKKSLCGPSDEVIEFVDALSGKVPDIGVVLDINHIILMGETFEHAFNTCKKYLRHVHLGNCILKDRSHEWWGGAHPPVGMEGGEIDIPQLTGIFRILLKTGYLNPEKPGTLSLEIRAFPGMSVEETIEDNLERVRKAWEMV